MQNLQDVLSQLDQIVASCRRRASPMGYFAALYYQMTAAVQRGIKEGVFVDGPRMERLDVLFAARYVEAYKARMLGWPTTQSWKVAFDTAETNQTSTLQHILMGINAHINLDLGIAAAQTCPGDSIWTMKDDFNAINDTIAGLTNRVQERLNVISPPLRWLDEALKTSDEGIADFSIVVARGASWQAATAMAMLEGDAQHRFVHDLDLGTADIGRRIIRPRSWVVRSALNVISLSEIGSVTDKIEVIRSLEA
jgi:Family of unknown function (DUF5995)